MNEREVEMPQLGMSQFTAHDWGLQENRAPRPRFFHTVFIAWSRFAGWALGVATLWASVGACPCCGNASCAVGLSGAGAVGIAVAAIMRPIEARCGGKYLQIKKRKIMTTEAPQARSDDAIPIVLVAGFLGAGKTTLMRRLLQDAHARGLKTALIINEFGVTDIDSHLLEAGGAELLLSVAGGCACCSGQDDLLWTLLELGERRDHTRPEVILLEASGLADPLLLLDTLTVASLLPLVRVGAMLSVVDHARFLLVRDEVAPLLIRQLQLADTIVLNKIDIAYRGADRGTRVEELVAQLQQLNERAAIVPVKGCAIDFTATWQRVFAPDLQPTALPPTAHEIPTVEAAGHAHYQTVLCPVPHPLERARLEAALQNLAPEVWRVKGFVRLRGEDGVWLLQFSGGARGSDWHLSPFGLAPGMKEPPLSLVFIGPALQRETLLRDFGGHNLLAMI